MAGRQRFYNLQDGAADLPLAEGYLLERFRPTLGRLRPFKEAGQPPLALYLFWRFASRGGYEIYVVRRDDAIVHTSHVLGKNPKFPFMRSNDLEIGPCWTHGDHRGRGIYPAVLARIAQDYPGRRLWIFCDEDNEGSRKGIERAGFSFFGTGARRRGIYFIDETGPR